MAKGCSVLQSFVALVGRICVSLIFVVAGLQKVVAFDATMALMDKAGVPHAEWVLIVAIILELGGGILVFLGLYARFGAFLLFLFVIPVTYYFHSFWGMEPGTAAYVAQSHHALKNLAIWGGTLYVMAYGPGSISFDWFRRRHCRKSPE
jgi:putative oxidoreductase